MEAYNLNKLIKVQLIKTQQSILYKWYDEKTYWWGKKSPAGIYNNSGGKIYLLDLPHYYITDKKVFIYPRIEFFFEDGHTMTKYFETDIQAETYANNLIFPDNWISTNN